jgi:hypothetical protein
MGLATGIKKNFYWNSKFFYNFFIIEGATEKVLQFMLQLKSIYIRNFGFVKLKCIFEHCRKVKMR